MIRALLSVSKALVTLAVSALYIIAAVCGLVWIVCLMKG